MSKAAGFVCEGARPFYHVATDLTQRVSRMKKLINSPDDVASETMEGFVSAFPQSVRSLEGVRALVRRDAPIQGKVAVVTGGGSGHEPMWWGYVGRGLPDASVLGNVFAAPPPGPIYQTAKAVDGGRGVLFIYGNYSGDVLNFNAAVEMLEAEHVSVAFVRTTDDVASAPPERKSERRGIAGSFFSLKIAAARAEEGAGLEEVTAITERANLSTRSMALALSSCTIPASGKPIFQLGEDQVAIGMGGHGEPGIYEGPMRSADELAQLMVSNILADQATKPGDEIAVLVNGMGATPLSELLIMYRAVSRLLREAELIICRSYVGNYCTTLDMAGCSVSLIRLDDELKRLLLAPADSPCFRQG
jgi:dihydroxyacetone kinase